MVLSARWRPRPRWWWRRRRSGGPARSVIWRMLPVPAAFGLASRAPGVAAGRRRQSRSRLFRLEKHDHGPRSSALALTTKWVYCAPGKGMRSARTFHCRRGRPSRCRGCAAGECPTPLLQLCARDFAARNPGGHLGGIAEAQGGESQWCPGEKSDSVRDTRDRSRV